MLSRYPITHINPTALEEVTAIDTNDLFPVNFKTIANSQEKDKK